MNPLEEGQSRKADKKHTVDYLTTRAEELSHSLGRNYTAKLFTMAAQDAKQLAQILDVLAQIDLNS